MLEVTAVDILQRVRITVKKSKKNYIENKKKV